MHFNIFIDSVEEEAISCSPVTVGSTSVQVRLGETDYTLDGDTCVKTTCEVCTNQSYSITLHK